MTLSAQGFPAVIRAGGKRVRLSVKQRFSPELLSPSEFAQFHALWRGFTVPANMMEQGFSGRGNSNELRVTGNQAQIAVSTAGAFQGVFGANRVAGKSAAIFMSSNLRVSAFMENIGFVGLAGALQTAANRQFMGLSANLTVAGQAGALQKTSNQRFLGQKGAINLLGQTGFIETVSNRIFLGTGGRLNTLGRASTLRHAAEVNLRGVSSIVRLSGRVANVRTGFGNRLKGVDGRLLFVGAIGAFIVSSRFVGIGAKASLSLAGQTGAIIFSTLGTLSRTRQIIPFKRRRIVRPEVVRTIKPDRSKHSLRA
jgi:hypothetical protein